MHLRRMLCVPAILLGAVGLAAAQAPSANLEDIRGVEKAIGYYFGGGADTAAFRRGFHPDFKMQYIGGDGSLQTVTIDQWVQRMARAPANPAEPPLKRWIAAMDITGNAASVRAVADGPDVQLVDYINLLKIDGEWKIMHKIFTRIDKK